jgi:hypothetical protein
MVAAGMGNRRARAVPIALLGALVLAAAGCGGGERQDADAPSGDFELDVTGASFPAKQQVAGATTLKLEVVNKGDEPIPNLAVVVRTRPTTAGQSPTAFGARSGDPTLNDSARPIWVLDQGPKGGDSAYVDTWAVGPLGPGATKTLEWKVTPVQPGEYTIAWRLAPALVGDVHLVGGRTKGSFQVSISDDPVPAHVGKDGEVVRGEEAGSSAPAQ